MAAEKLYVVKIGGNVIDDKAALSSFLEKFSKIKSKKILIHGGGKIATEISKGLGIEAQMVDGRRITDEETLKIVTMVYAGLINKGIVAQLQSQSCNAIGLTGADANTIVSEKRPIKNGVDYGYVGDVKQVNTTFLQQIIDSKITPIFAPLTHDGKGNILNTNADTVASAIAQALAEQYEVNLVYCFELKGVLYDFEDKTSVIPVITTDKYQTLKEQGIISKGMIPKLDNAFDAIAKGVAKVVICDATDLLTITDGATLGTTLQHS